MLGNSCDDQISVYSHRAMALMASKDLMSTSPNSCKGAASVDSNSKYVRYTAEQVQALEKLYNECPKPSSLRRQQLVRENPILQNIEPKQIKVWFQNRRCREKQRKESFRLQTVNAKLTAMNKLLMDENDRLQKQVGQLLYENGYLRQQVGASAGITTDTSCDSVVTSGTLQHQQQQHHHGALVQLNSSIAAAASQQLYLSSSVAPLAAQDVATYSGILFLAAEEAAQEFLQKATGTAIDWIQMPGMKPGPDTTQMVNISHIGCTGIAARACGLIVGLDPAGVVEALKDKPSWLRDCRRLTTVFSTRTPNSNGTLEVLYTQMFAPTTLAPPRDFYTLRYISALEDGGIVMCERSITNSHMASIVAPQMPPFVRGEMHSSGVLVRPCEGSGSIVIIVDHHDLEPLSVPSEVLQPLNESPILLAHKVTIPALRHLRHISQTVMIDSPVAGQQPAAVRSLSHRLAKGFNDAVNTFTEDGWMAIANEGLDDVSIAVRSCDYHICKKDLAASVKTLNSASHANKGIMCARASMLLQNVPPSLLIRFLREHRSEWVNQSLEETQLQSMSPIFSSFQTHGFSNLQVLQPQIHAVEEDEFLELMKMEPQDGEINPSTHLRDMFLLQLCSGLEGNGDSGGRVAQMVFAPVDASMSEDIELIPSGFRVIPLDDQHNADNGNHGTSARTLDLASTLEVGTTTSSYFRTSSGSENQHTRSVLTIAFQFKYEIRLEEEIAAMVRQHVHNVVATVQRVAMALAPPRIDVSPPTSARCLPDQGLMLAKWICKSYKMSLGIDLVHVDAENNDEYLRALWKLSDAVVCCTWPKTSRPVFTFSNQAALDMLETTSLGLQDLQLEKTLPDEDSRRSINSVVNTVMDQGYMCLPAGIRLSSMGRAASYDRAIAWKVISEETENTVDRSLLLQQQQSQQSNFHGIAFLFIDWSLHIPPA